MMEHQQAAANAAKLTIDGKEYQLDQLSEEAHAQINNLHGTDMEIARLQQQLAIARTARMAYALALKKALPQPSSAAG